MSKYLSVRLSLDTKCWHVESSPVRYGGQLHGVGIILGPIAVLIEWGTNQEWEDEGVNHP